VLDVQKSYAEVLQDIDPTVEISIERTIDEALILAKRFGDDDNGMQILIMGSLASSW